MNVQTLSLISAASSNLFGHPLLSSSLCFERTQGKFAALSAISRSSPPYSLNHPTFVAVEKDIRAVANGFLTSLEMTIQIAGNGVIVANDTITLCESLNEHSALDILEFIEEIRTNAWLTHESALNASHSFESCRQGVIQVRILK